MSNVETDAGTRAKLVRELNQNMPVIKALCGTRINPEVIFRLVLFCADRNPFLLKCTVLSIVHSAIQSAEIGLEVGSALNHAYIVPYFEDSQWVARFTVSAFGYAELAYRSGKVKSIWWHPVYKGDKFEYRLGDTPRIVHEPAGENEEDGNLTHVYAVAEMVGGGKIRHILTLKQIDRLKNMNPAVKKGKFSPWTDNKAEMACAKVVKAICKRLPKSRELAQAMSMDDAVESGKPEIAESIVNALPIPGEQVNFATRADRVAGRMGVTIPNDTEEHEEGPYTGPVVYENEPEGALL